MLAISAAAYTRTIPLSRGYFALVDADLYDWLNSFHWHADVRKGGRQVIAKSWLGDNGRRSPVKMHRLIMDTMDDDVKIDHKNACSGLMTADSHMVDNRRSNLRRADQSKNNMNTDRPVTNSSGYKGIIQDKRTGDWIARITITKNNKRRRVHLGRFATKQEAALAYDQAARQIHDPEFIRLNFPAIEAYNDALVQKRIDRFLHKAAWVHNKSGVRYITWQARESRWRVSPRKNGKVIHVGSFTTLEEARAALAQYQQDSLRKPPSRACGGGRPPAKEA